MVKKDDVKKNNGTFGKVLDEPVPGYNHTDSEAKTIIKNKNNAWIILGRDRTGSPASGYGAQANPRTGAIDLVVGLGSPRPKAKDKDGEGLAVDKNFKNDAARIYISQKTDIDKAFNLGEPKSVREDVTRLLRPTIYGKSGIGIKADNIRIIGRHSIRLITNTNLSDAGGESVYTIQGIDLVAGNKDNDLQPLVKGKNLVSCLTIMSDNLISLNGIVHDMMVAQAKFDSNLANHFHVSPAGGIPVYPSIMAMNAGVVSLYSKLVSTQMGVIASRINETTFKANYLIPTAKDGDPKNSKYILSRWNNTN